MTKIELMLFMDSPLFLFLFLLRLLFYRTKIRKKIDPPYLLCSTLVATLPFLAVSKPSIYLAGNAAIIQSISTFLVGDNGRRDFLLGTLNIKYMYQNKAFSSEEVPKHAFHKSQCCPSAQGTTGTGLSSWKNGTGNPVLVNWKQNGFNEFWFQDMMYEILVNTGILSGCNRNLKNIFQIEHVLNLYLT